MVKKRQIHSCWILKNLTTVAARPASENSYRSHCASKFVKDKLNEGVVCHFSIRKYLFEDKNTGQTLRKEKWTFGNTFEKVRC